MRSVNELTRYIEVATVAMFTEEETKKDFKEDVEGKERIDNPSKKKAKTNSLLRELLLPNVLDREDEIRETYLANQPYSYGQIKDLFVPDFLTSVKEEIKGKAKVNFKESDLFRVYQSIDMANLHPGSEFANQLPHVMKLREILYSQEWRSFVERLTGLPPSTLTTQIDCACNCHAPGCHLLCHDDVIGTRKISYIIYLTESDWKPDEGGSLELYGPQKDSDKHGSPLPVARVWPTFNSMAFFVVQPGLSFHAVQEVLGDRPRLSLQGWYHAKEPPKNIELATLQQLKARGDYETIQVSKLVSEFEDEEEGKIVLSVEDKKYLSKYLQEEYLTEDSMNEIQKKFESDSSVQLRHFLKAKWVPKMEPQKVSSAYDDAYYKFGISAEWQLRGPAHKQRFLDYQTETLSAKDSQGVGSLMHHVKTKLFESEQIARYLKRVTSLGKPIGIRNSQIRRFRPGLDYTVAHYGLLLEKPVLDATMCFVYDEDDDKDAWESGDVGGFECYIEADDEEEQEAGPADEYNEDDDTALLSVSASNNTLSLVYRDPGTMRFVKYVGSSAPSSRYDICMEYEVNDDEEDDEEEQTEGASFEETALEE